MISMNIYVYKYFLSITIAYIKNLVLVICKIEIYNLII